MKKLIIILILVLIFSFAVACDKGERTINDFSVDLSTVEDFYVVGDRIDHSSIRIIVTYSDGESEAIPVISSMLSEYDYDTVGLQTITVAYEGISHNFNVIFIHSSVTATYIAGVNGQVDNNTEVVQEVSYQGESNVVTAVPDVGYDFSMWSDGVLESSRIDKYMTADISVTAIFEPKLFFVSVLDKDGTLIVKNSVLYANNYTVPTAPIEEGLIFDHWIDNNTLQTVTNFIVYEDMSIKPIYNESIITVSYYGEEDDIVFTNEYSYGYLLLENELPVSVPVIEGQAFLQWVLKDSLLEVDFASGYALYGDTDFKAIYSEDACEVSFETNGGNVIPNKYVLYNSYLSGLQNATKIGAIFVGWYSDAALTILYNVQTKITDDITLYAGYSVLILDVFIVISPENTTTHKVEYGNIIYQPARPYREGNTFLGWYSDTSYQIEYNFSTPITETTYIYAGWEGKPYSVSFNMQAPTLIIDTINLKWGDYIDPVIPDRTGYTFGYWTIGKITGEEFNTSTTPVTKNMTLYAIWVPDIITLNALWSDGGCMTRQDGNSLPADGNIYINFDGFIYLYFQLDYGYMIDYITINAGEDTEYNVSQVTIDNGIERFMLTKNHRTIYVQFKKITYSMIATGNTGGSVTPLNGTAEFETSYTFNISPISGYEIKQIKVNGVIVPVVAEYYITSVTCDISLIITFGIIRYTINVSSEGGGTISPTGATLYNYGTSGTFSYNCNNNYHIKDIIIRNFDWDDEISLIDTPIIDGWYHDELTETITASDIYENRTLRIVFEGDTYNVNATQNNPSYGTITPSGDSVINYGSSIIYEMTPSLGYEVTDILVNDISRFSNLIAGENGTMTYSFASLLDENTIVAIFSIIEYEVVWTTYGEVDLELNASQQNDSGRQDIEYGTDIEFVITPEEFMYIENMYLTLNGVQYNLLSLPSGTDYTCTNNQGTYTLNINEITSDIVLIIYSEWVNYLMTINVGLNGSIRINGVNYYDDSTLEFFHGQQLNITVVPDVLNGYEVEAIFVDEEPIELSGLGGNESYEILSAIGDKTITSSYVISNYDVNISATGEGIILEGLVERTNSIINRNFGTDIILNIVPNAGYTLSALIVNGFNRLYDVDDNIYGVYSLSNDMEIEFIFEIIVFELTSINSSDGTVSISSGYVFKDTSNAEYSYLDINYGETVVYTLTPNIHNCASDISVVISGVNTILYDGYNDEKWQYDIDMGTGIGTLTVKNVQENRNIGISFEPSTYLVTTEVYGSGNISPNTDIEVVYSQGGCNLNYIISATTGWHLESIEVNGVAVTFVSTTSYTLTDIESDCNIIFTFVEN